MADGGRRTTHEHPFPWEEAFPRKETMEYFLTSFLPHAFGEDIGTIPRLSNLSSSMEQGLEWTHCGSQARKERILWYKCAGLSHLWDIHLKPRHVLGASILTLPVA